ncbi:hypothetical protein Kpol_1018p166 [Vanderwaltozyma polyspora DSM 70294]|uniref:Vacuolar ATPase assembly integral membrane protein VPH2 n=1 Tax=Vanderwaltozyma polyspora (strain ATCC 22028 / DSM 70294 / BCRC 21397 / CBS 2163 / NBRC 10782 / NRRL Y-8283 / UCD 57-17) TaxID=436907 RepID=A7TE06_VANPO|nr:uncharacterized protein Kpol_1018p166 [Vanderwaltozyma polyspora DSM 70294]EDO19626.1 hypothetical protein Kpol_1018p166 [Vanderwaltozyma polyspora DSM 70294]
MFEIKLNENISKFLNGLECVENKDELKKILANDSISMNSLLEFYKSKKSTDDITMSQLLCPLDFKYKEKRIPGSDYSEEFRSQLEYLKTKQQEESYQEMLNKERIKINRDDDWVSPSQMNKQIKEQVTTIFNIIISVISVVTAIWYWTNSSMNISAEYRILLCLFFGLLVLVAEVVVYSSYLRKIEEAKNLERSKFENRQIVKTIKL